MTPFSLLCVVTAILSNAISNVFFKRAMQSAVTGEGAFTAVISVLKSPFLWLGLGFAVLLLVSYLTAIRTAPLGSTYAMVTGTTIALLTLWGAVTGSESIQPMALLGTGLIILGFVLISTTVRGA